MEHKHWPATTEGERERDYKNLLQEGGVRDVILEEGDSLYIPIMWFHSVHVDKEKEWSVTGNRYFYHDDEGANEGVDYWRRVIEEKKGFDFLNYEKHTNSKVC